MRSFKNRERSVPTFLNINLLGPCNVDCYFCLGRDLAGKYFQHNQLVVHFSQWENFGHAVRESLMAGISRVYVTGQTTDSLAYKHIGELVSYLKGMGFSRVGLRTNGMLAINRMEAINSCDSVGYSIHTLKPEASLRIMGTDLIPDWNGILRATSCPRVRVSIVIGRYNIEEVYDLLAFLSSYPWLQYIQLRKVSTDNRSKELLLDAEIFEKLHEQFAASHTQMGEYEGAPIYDHKGLEVIFWRTVETHANSFNYFTDGTFSREYFIVKGYAAENSLDSHSREFALPGTMTSRSNIESWEKTSPLGLSPKTEG